MAPILRCSAVVFRRNSVLLVHRTTSDFDDWVLPGGSPRGGESMAACARREVREETGLWADPGRIAFVLEAAGPQPAARTVDIVFLATESAPRMAPEVSEPGMMPVFVPVDQVHELNLRPPVAGHLRGLLRSGGRRYAPYLADMWRPDGNGRPRLGPAGLAPAGLSDGGELP